MSNERPKQRTRSRSIQPPQHSSSSPGSNASSKNAGSSSGSSTNNSLGLGNSTDSKTGSSSLKKRAGGGKFAFTLLAAIILAAGAYFSLGGGDSVSEQETQTRLSNYQSFVATSSLPLKFVNVQEMDQAFESMPESVSTEQKEELRIQVNTGQVKLAWITLWDTHSEDGDILRFESASSFPIEVMALNQKTTIAIPYPANGEVMVTGVRDGGGGITIALESGATQIAWPTMQVNDQFKLPVTPGY